MERVPMELAKGVEFDVQVVNDVLDQAIERVDALIQERTKGLLNHT
jgi:guanylate kinase